MDAVLQLALAAPWNQPATLAALAPAFRAATPLPSLILPSAIRLGCAPTARFTPFFVADRGRYDAADLPEQPSLRPLAEAVCARALRHAETRLIHLNPGGYALFLDDHRRRLEGPCLEVILDLSRAERTAGPAVEYRCNAGRLVVPQLPGLLAIVARDEQTWRCDRYLPITAGEIPVLRLRATYLFAD